MGLIENSPIVKYFMDKGVEKGLEKGMEKSLEKSILTVLETRFGRIDRKALEGRIRQVGDQKKLEALHRKAVTTPSLAAFNRGLRPAPRRGRKAKAVSSRSA